ncbi:hypothetical protein DVH24_023892, partial [Malus domestica]
AIVPKHRVIWDDLPVGDAIIVDDLIDCYKLHKVNSPPSTFNLLMVQEFYANVPSKFPDYGGQVYVRGVYVPLDSNVICDILGLELSKVSNMHSLYLITCHYDIHAYHRKAYLDSFIPLCQSLALSISINYGNPTLEAARVLYAMLSLSDVPSVPTNNNVVPRFILRIGFPFHLDNVCPRSTKELDKGFINLSNMMSAVAHGDLRPPPPPNASQETKIAHLDHSLLTQSLSQLSLNPSSFVPEPYVCPPKLVPHHLVAPLSSSYFVASSSGQSSVVAAKMAVIEKGKSVSSPDL